MRRRTLLAGAALASVSLGARAQTPTKMTIATGVDPAFSQFYVAKEGGLFGKNGLDVTINTGPSGSAMVPFLVNNQVHAAYGSDLAGVINNGQSCVAAKRFVIHRDVFADFCARFVARVEALRVGDPMRDDTEIGPLATPQIVDDLNDQVRRTVAAGARVLTGGGRVEGLGNFLPAHRPRRSSPGTARPRARNCFEPWRPFFKGGRPSTPPSKSGKDTPFRPWHPRGGNQQPSPKTGAVSPPKIQGSGTGPQTTGEVRFQNSVFPFGGV